MVQEVRSKISSMYTNILADQKIKQCFPGPARNLRWYNSFTSYFRNEVVYQICLEEKVQRVLIVGDGGGRDYWYLRWKGLCNLYPLDIAQQSEVPGLIQCDISTDNVPFEPHSFNCVIACDVLEHLYDDVKALQNIRKLLVKNGILIISGPYWHDKDRTHVRIHNPVIVKRMLEDNGFIVDQQLSRGGITQIYMRLLHPVNLAINLLLFYLTKRTIFQWVNNILYKMNRVFIRWYRLPYIEHCLFGAGDGLNGYIIKARKMEDTTVNIQDLCRAKFADMTPEKM